MHPASKARFSGHFLDEFIQCSHAEKKLDNYPCGGVLDEELLARIYAVSSDRYRELRITSARAVQQAATKLLRDQALAELVNRLPFKRNSRIVAFGDSMTDDWQSWAYLLEELLQRRRPRDDIKVVNAGRSGDTTADLIRRIDSILELGSDWIIIMIGTNDAARFGPPPNKTLISSNETERNLVAIREILSRGTSAKLVWLTPPPISSDDYARSMEMRELTVRVSNKDLFMNAESVRKLPDPVIDLWTLLGDPPRPEFFFDGLHPGPLGHSVIVSGLVRGLSQSRVPTS